MGFEPLTVLILIGFTFKCLGFILRDELLLRVLVASGMIADVTFYLNQPDPIIPPLVANSILITINAVLVLKILKERTKWGLSEADRALYAHFPSLAPGQFRRVLALAKRETVTEDIRLISEGASVDHLYFINAPAFEIEKAGQTYAAQGPAFAGEIAFLTQAPSSAAVSVPMGTEVISFESDALRQMMRKSKAIDNGMIALFGRDLARKVAASVPLQGTTSV